MPQPLVRSLEDSRVLIVGGTAGIGYASARHLLGLGAQNMVIAGRNPERGAAAAEELGANVTYLPCDATEAVQAEALAEAANARMGGIDFLLSCGGGDPMPALLHKIPLAELMPTINAVQAPILHPARAVLPYMSAQGGGAIVCIASDAGKLATSGETAIGAAMASIAMFCRAMAIEAKRNGIRVNCITPSIVQGTPLYDRLMEDAFAGKLFGKAEQMAALGVVTPQDIAETVGFLAGPGAAKMTGQAISVTGGISAI